MERTTARKSSKFGTTYTTTWNGEFSASFTFWPAMGGFATVAHFGGNVRRGFEPSYESCMRECASICDPEHNGRYVYDNEPHQKLGAALDKLKELVA